MPSPAAIELAAAAAWPATETERSGPWLLRASPLVPHRRNNSALPAGGAHDPAVVERFYAVRGQDPVVAVAPLEDHAELDAELARRGWPAEGATDVLVADAARLREAAPSGGAAALRATADPREPAAPVDPLAWPDDGVREQVLPRSEAELFAFAVGQRGAVLCLRTGDLAGIFRLHVAPGSRRQGVARRLLAACATVAPALYAQVERDNAAAQGLFASAGFRRSHGYHYRRGAGRADPPPAPR